MRKMSFFTYLFVALGLFLVTSCGNNPYPDENETGAQIIYSAYSVPPKDLDPQIAYTSNDVTFLNYCYEGLFSYDYLKRPLELVPHLAKAVPVGERLMVDGKERIVYHFNLREKVRFIDDRCFEGGKGREVTARDLEYAFKRLADPQTNCPVLSNFHVIRGLKEYGAQVEALTKLNPTLTAYEVYKRAGDLSGFKVTGRYSFDLILDRSYPQLLYWLAMPFVSAIAHEAVTFYDGTRKSPISDEPMDFNKHPVGTGPYQFEWEGFNSESSMVLKRNRQWWGEKNDQAMGISRFPAQPSCVADVKNISWTKANANHAVAQADFIKLYKEKEALPLFSKFTQGYYDLTVIPREKMDELLSAGGGLSSQMTEKGVRLVKDYRLDIAYMGFNMQDEVLGAPIKFKDPKLEANRAEELLKRRKLRQALTLAINYKNFLRIFFKHSAIDAQSMIPPGIAGYAENYKNKYKVYDPKLVKAKRLLAEAGYKNGIDPKTGQPLELTYDLGKTTPTFRQRGDFIANEWAKLGIKVNVHLNDFNQFVEKVATGRYQVNLLGWAADYPDPENFLFLFYGPNSKRLSKFKPNGFRYENKVYDELFDLMETLENGKTVLYQGKPYTRLEIITKLKTMLEEECVTIPLSHSVNFNLYHSWLTCAKPHPQFDSKFEYYQVDSKSRAEKRKAWNKPIVWPIFIFLLAAVLFVVPAILTIKKESR